MPRERNSSHMAQGQIGLLIETREQPIALSFQKKGALAAHGSAAALPVARTRCVHFTTLATLTFERGCAALVVSPPATNATTRSRRSREYARAIPAGLRPAGNLKHCSFSLGIPRGSMNVGKDSSLPALRADEECEMQGRAARATLDWVDPG